MIVAAVMFNENANVGFIGDHLSAISNLVTPVPDPFTCLVQHMRKFLKSELHKVDLALIAPLNTIENALVAGLHLFNDQVHIVDR